MPNFGSINHVSLSVTELDWSHRSYTDVLGFVMLNDFGHARFYLHQASVSLLGLAQHDEGTGRPFSELNTGLDHISFAVSKEDMAAWEERFEAMGVTYTPRREMEFGSHLNFRDPDNIALEFMAPNEEVAGALRALATGELSAEAFAGVAQQRVAGFEGVA